MSHTLTNSLQLAPLNHKHQATVIQINLLVFHLNTTYHQMN